MISWLWAFQHVWIYDGTKVFKYLSVNVFEVVYIKAELLNTVIWPMDKMTMCHAWGITCSNTLTENYDPCLQFSSALQRVLASSSSLFWSSSCQLQYFGSLSLLSWYISCSSRQIFSEKLTHCTHSTWSAPNSR